MRVDMIQRLHTSTSRDYFARMGPAKPDCMKVAALYGREYWDGDRKFGYGGYVYDGRWNELAKNLISRFDLRAGSRVLDLGCGKAHLLHELRRLNPKMEITGLDNSDYALGRAPEEVRPFLRLHDLREGALPFDSGSFDLVLSLNVLHNLHLKELFASLREIQRVGRQKYVCVESYRDARELTHLQCWALTCASFYSETDWQDIFEMTGYDGDYEFIFFS